MCIFFLKVPNAEGAKTAVTGYHLVGIKRQQLLVGEGGWLLVFGPLGDFSATILSEDFSAPLLVDSEIWGAWGGCLAVRSFDCLESSQLSLSTQSKIQKWGPVLEGEVGQNWVEPSSRETESRPRHPPHISR